MSELNQNDRVRQAFAERFCLALKQLGYSASRQKEVSQLFGVSAQAVRKWAEGQSLPTSARLPQVAFVLGVRRAWLQDGEEPMYSNVAHIADEPGNYGKENNIAIHHDELKLLHLYKQLSVKQREMLYQLASLFVNEGG